MKTRIGAFDWTATYLLSLSCLLAACGASPEVGDGAADADALPPSSKEEQSGALMDVPSAPLATVRTPQGTRIDFLELEPGGGVSFTEAGPESAPQTLPAIIEEHGRDAIAVYTALTGVDTIPGPLSLAVERAGKLTFAESVALAPSERYVEFAPDLPAAAAPLQKPEVDGIAAKQQAIDTSNYSGTSCSAASAQSYALGTSKSFLSLSTPSEHRFQWNDVVVTGEFVCTVYRPTSGGARSFVYWKIETRPWSSWGLRGNFQIDSGTWRSFFTSNFAVDYDYRSNVYNVLPDTYHRGAYGG